jgi:hypothetical protein
MLDFNSCFLHFLLCAGRFFYSENRKRQKKTFWLNEALEVLGPNDLRPILLNYMVYGDFEMR